MSSPYPPGPPLPEWALNQYPTGQLVLNLRKPLGLGAGALITPSVTIDGYSAPARWDWNALTVPAGPRQVAIESRYLWAYGRQQVTVDVPPGRTVELHYSGPLTSFGTGAIGPTPQPRPGVGAFALILAVPVLILLLLLGSLLIGALSG